MMESGSGNPAPHRPGPSHPTPGRAVRAAIFAGTIFVILALAVMPLLSPILIHPALDAAGSAALLGVEPAGAYEMSDRSVSELLWGPATFDFAGPGGSAFYDAAEQGHLRDARTLLWLCLVAGALSAAGIAFALVRSSADARRRLWGTISAAGAVTASVVVVLGVVSLVAFDTLFRLFHEVFFPGGNWAFDPSTQRLVQLYPFAFWQIATAALGVLLVLLGTGAWWLGRHLAQPNPTLPARARPSEEG